MARTLGAQEPEPPAAAGDAAPSAAPQPKASLDEAKELFRKGNELREAGDWEGALDFYLRSRRLVPSVPNTMNSALTLDHLGRYDEALEMYQDLLTRFVDLDEKDRKAVAPVIAALRGKLGEIEVSSNVAGVLMIDGRQRGNIPLSSPVPVLPGTHLIRVLKDGYDTFETRVEVKVRQKTLIDARLKRLSRVGKLRVDDAKLAGAELFIDGGKVGVLPWEGTLSPGRHRYFVRKDDVGSAPKTAIVVEGQTVLVEVKAGPLGQDLRFLVEPPSAELFVNGASVGNGEWQGRLPIGKYVLEAREFGYLSGRQTIDVTRDRGGTTTLELRIDPESPRWNQTNPGKLWIEGFVGFGVAPSFGSDMEGDCDLGRCSRESLRGGPVAGGRAAYEFPIGASIELGAGVLALSTSLERKRSDTYDGGGGQNVAVTYTYTDRVRIRGPFVVAGAGYPIPINARLKVGLRLDVGTVFAAVSDEVDASASALDKRAGAEVQNSGKPVRSAVVFVNPEARLMMSFGKLHAGFGIGVLVFPVSGPRLENGDTRVIGTCDPTPPPPGQSRPVECAKDSGAVSGERSFSPFVVILPTLSAGYTF